MTKEHAEIVQTHVHDCAASHLYEDNTTATIHLNLDKGAIGYRVETTDGREWDNYEVWLHETGQHPDILALTRAEKQLHVELNYACVIPGTA